MLKKRNIRKFRFCYNTTYWEEHLQTAILFFRRPRDLKVRPRSLKLVRHILYNLPEKKPMFWPFASDSCPVWQRPGRTHSRYLKTPVTSRKSKAAWKTSNKQQRPCLMLDLRNLPRTLQLKSIDYRPPCTPFTSLLQLVTSQPRKLTENRPFSVGTWKEMELGLAWPGWQTIVRDVRGIR